MKRYRWLGHGLIGHGPGRKNRGVTGDIVELDDATFARYVADFGAAAFEEVKDDPKAEVAAPKRKAKADKPADPQPGGEG